MPRRSSPEGPVPAPDLVVVGLGNPGGEYARTRHNLGFRVADALANEAGTRWRKAPGPALVADLEIAGRAARVAKPLTWMNRSGLAVRPLRDAAPGLPPDRLLVVADDLDLPLGRLRFRRAGGPGGHNGLRSVIAELGTPDFPRLRLGIGRPAAGGDDAVVDYVLEPFLAEEEPAVSDLITRALDGIRIFAAEGVEAAMNRLNAG